MQIRFVYPLIPTALILQNPLTDFFNGGRVEDNSYLFQEKKRIVSRI